MSHRVSCSNRVGATIGLCLVFGCSPATQQATPTTVTMDPVLVEAHQEDQGEITTAVFDVRELFERANVAMTEERFDDALEDYNTILSRFPSSSLATPARYNSALCLQQLNRLDEAARRYLELVEHRPTGQDAKDALFQAALCYESLEQWSEAAAVLFQLLEREDLVPREHLEALARRGAALIEHGELDDGERVLRRAVSLAREMGQDAVPTDYYLAQAQHFLGEGQRRRISQVELSPDERAFRTALQARCHFLLRAQTQYVQAIRVGNAEWAAASAYRIGQMYSSLYSEIMDVPVPEPDIPQDITDPEDVEVFRQEYPAEYRRILQEYLSPLLQNAIRWWETNLMMVERTGVQGPWVGQTRSDLERVRQLLDEIEGDQTASEESEENPQPPSQLPAS